MTDARPTLDTVAQAAGVSRMTVSNAYNRPDQLSAATRERVLAVAAELGYAGPDPAGRSLRRGRAGAVGVLLSENLVAAFSDPGLVAFLAGIADQLGQAGQAMLLIPAEADDDGSLVRGAIVDAFITCGVEQDHPSLVAAMSRHVPLVAAGSVSRPPGVPVVSADNRAGGRLVGEHLAALGHRSFGVVLRTPDPLAGGPRIAARVGMRERFDGFTSAVAAAGLDAAGVQVAEVGESSIAAGYEAGLRLLGTPDRRPTAVFATTDALALGVLDAAAELGVQVPDELSVVGFDDIAAAARSRPPLTTVAQSLGGQGARAAQLALRLVAGTAVRSQRVDAELVVRGSTAAAP